jgi:hypothetical protein
MSVQDDLQRAYALIKVGNKEEAVQVLIPIIRADNNNADAWWLLANAVPQVDQARSALKQFIKLRPDDERARKLIDQLGGARPTPPAAPTSASSDTFDDDPFASDAPPVYADDPFVDDNDQNEVDVWDDPFGHEATIPRGTPRRPPPKPMFGSDDPFADMPNQGLAANQADEPDDALFMPPERRPRSASSDRPASIDDDLMFDDDPFDPAKDNAPPKARPSGGSRERAAGSGGSKRSASGDPRARSGSSKSASKTGAKTSGARGNSGKSSGGKSAGKRRPAAPIIVDDFAHDPFAKDAAIFGEAKAARGNNRAGILILLVVIVIAVGVGAIFLMNRPPVGELPLPSGAEMTPPPEALFEATAESTPEAMPPVIDSTPEGTPPPLALDDKPPTPTKPPNP